MRTIVHTLQGSPTGTRRTFPSLHFGPTDTGRRALLQCALHADEIPPMLVAQHLRKRLTALEAAGHLAHEIVLVPACNPIGLSQQIWGRHQGRFEINSGHNFNRHYPDLAADAAARVKLTQDAATNTRLLRVALHEVLAERSVETELQSLRHTLMDLAIDADVVLDLHCDNQAVMHLYSTPHHAELTQALSRCVQAPLALLAEESGDFPFDESCSMVWPKLQALLSGFPVELACYGATVEHRGESDVTHALASQDAEGLLRFLATQGFVSGGVTTAEAYEGSLRPLAGSMPLNTPHAGVVVYHAELGDEVKAGQLMVEVIDPMSGESSFLHSPIDGLFYAREQQRWAQAGQKLARVAGFEAKRKGKLLSA
jgi:predicted deacylase